MSTWWYSINSSKIGPVEESEIRRLIEADEIKQDTLVWKEGMNEWVEIKEVEDLQGLWSAIPPPLPEKSLHNGERDANLWLRFFARVFDVWWEVVLVSVVVAIVLSEFGFRVDGSGDWYLFYMLCLFVAFILDAIVYNVVGNTPGKALLKLNVRWVSGKKLSGWDYLERNISVWAHGFAFGLPFMYLFSMAYQATRLSRGKKTTYDEGMYVVTSERVGVERKIIFSVLFVLLYMIMVVVYNL